MKHKGQYDSFTGQLRNEFLTSATKYISDIAMKPKLGSVPVKKWPNSWLRKENRSQMLNLSHLASWHLLENSVLCTAQRVQWRDDRLKEKAK
jgi:hypothetical protein